MRVPFRWLGGKARLVPWLLSVLPQHQVYVEVFGGAGALLLAKPPSGCEVFNDRDEGVVHFFRVLRDPLLGAQLRQQLSLTPYARAEYAWCRATWAEVVDPVERARRWYVVAAQSFGGVFGRAWGFSCAPGKQEARAYQGMVASLEQVAARFASVQVECDDFAAILARYDGPHTLLFCDPPYVPSARKDGGYRYEMTEADHRRLLEAVTRCQGKVLICGYPSVLYSEALVGWRCLMRQVTCSAVGRTRRSGLQGVGMVSAQHQRTECLWLSPGACMQTSLWEELDDVSIGAAGSSTGHH
jgi:DNA adenine methylase